MTWHFALLCFLYQLMGNIPAPIEARSVSESFRQAPLQPPDAARAEEPAIDQLLQESDDLMEDFVGTKATPNVVVMHPAQLHPQVNQQTRQSPQATPEPNQHIQQSHELQQPQQSQDTIFVVRVHKKYGTTLLDHYADQLRGIAAVWCIYDNSRKSDKKTIDNLRALEGRNKNFHFLIINDNTIRNVLPNAKWQWQDDHRHVTPSIGYYMHTPSIIALLGEHFIKPDQPPLPEFVWIIEGDAFFTGSVRNFVEHYMSETADYIGKYQTRSPEWLGKWQHWSQKTFDPNTLSKSGKVNIISKSEHVERYSVKLLMHLRDIMQQNKLLYGEIFAGTVCGALDWCHMQNLPVSKNNGVGDRKQFCFSCQVGQDIVEAQLARGCGHGVATTTTTTTTTTPDPKENSKKCPEQASIWVHAVKWIRDDDIVERLLNIHPSPN